jgi:hypothetical protein
MPEPKQVWREPDNRHIFHPTEKRYSFVGSFLLVPTPLRKGFSNRSRPNPQPLSWQGRGAIFKAPLRIGEGFGERSADLCIHGSLEKKAIHHKRFRFRPFEGALEGSKCVASKRIALG